MSVLGVLYIYIYLHLGNILFTTIMKAVIGRGLIQYRSIQIYHVWEGYLRKIPVERQKKFRAEGNLVSRLVFFANTPPKHDISV